MLRELKHPNIVRYYDRIINKSRQSIMVIMEYCEKGDLQTEILRRRKRKQHFKEQEIWSMYMHIVLAIHELNHDKNKKVIHRRLTPNNILISKNNTLKLGDFGHSKILEGELSFAMTSMKANKYMSPE